MIGSGADSIMYTVLGSRCSYLLGYIFIGYCGIRLEGTNSYSRTCHSIGVGRQRYCCESEDWLRKDRGFPDPNYSENSCPESDY